MLSLISTLSIFLLIIIEIIVTIICVKKLCASIDYVDCIHVKMLNNARKILEFNDELKKTLKKINKVVRILTNKRLLQTKRMIMMLMDIIQVILLFKSMNLQKGSKSIDINLLKNVAYTRIIQQILKKLLDGILNFCSI